LDEIALIHKIVNGDTESFRFLYRLHASSAWRLAISICKQQANAEEAVQNSFIAAFKYIHTFQQESSFKTWLLRIVFNEAIRIQKKEKVYKWEDLEDIDTNTNPISIDGASLLHKKEIKEQVAKIMTLLHEKESLVLNLFYLEELSIKEVANVSGFSEANVKVLLHRARKNFKQYFEKTNLVL
jgi:RNA polymerase sigma factor (sigma-70 family)